MDKEAIFSKYNDFIKFEVADITARLNKLPEIVGYYQSVYFTLKTKFNKYSMDLDRRWMERYLYYKNDFNISLNNSEIKAFIEKDLEYLDTKEKLVKVQEMMENIEEILKGLDSMRWTLKSLIDWQKFQLGVY